MTKLFTTCLAVFGLTAGAASASWCDCSHGQCCYPSYGCGVHVQTGLCNLGCSCPEARRCHCPPPPRPQWYLEYPCPGELYTRGIHPWTYFGADASAYGCAEPDVSNKPYYWYAK